MRWTRVKACLPPRSQDGGNQAQALGWPQRRPRPDRFLSAQPKPCGKNRSVAHEGPSETLGIA